MISLTKVKEFLGITDSTYDAQITAMIPTAEAKYREIAGYNFYYPIIAVYESGNNYFELANTYEVRFGEFLVDLDDSENNDIIYLNYGDLIEDTIDNSSIPAEAYITNVDYLNDRVYISDTFTDDGDEIAVTTNISYYPTISALIWYMIGQQSTTAQDTKEVTARRVGPLSVTFNKNDIDKNYGVPYSIVNAIPKYSGVW